MAAPRPQGGVPASVLGGNPLMPRMMLGVVNRFAPAGHRPVAVQAGAAALHAAAYAKHDQEDAQDFLHHVLDKAHLVRQLSFPLSLFRSLGSRHVSPSFCSAQVKRRTVLLRTWPCRRALRALPPICVQRFGD